MFHERDRLLTVAATHNHVTQDQPRLLDLFEAPYGLVRPLPTSVYRQGDNTLYSVDILNRGSDRTLCSRAWCD